MIHEYPNGRRGIRAFAVYSWMAAFAGGEFWVNRPRIIHEYSNGRAVFAHSRPIRGWLPLLAESFG